MMQDMYQALIKEPEGSAPVVFAFHGTGGDENQFFGLAQEMVPRGGIVSPRGDVSEMGAARYFRRTGEGVYDMQDLARATNKIVAYVEGWKARFPDSAVYGFGYSNGANILASVMMARPDLFDRIGLLHPLIPWDPEAVAGMKDRKVLISAGQRDPICPWPLTEKLVDWSLAQGAEVATSFHDGGHELRREEIDALAEFLAAPDSNVAA